MKAHTDCLAPAYILRKHRVVIDRKEEERKVEKRDRDEVKDRRDLGFGSVS